MTTIQRPSSRLNAIWAVERRIKDVVSLGSSDPGAKSNRRFTRCFIGIPPLLQSMRYFREEAGCVYVTELLTGTHHRNETPVLWAPIGYSAVHPPSMISDDPVISVDASLARKTTAPMRSSIVP